MSSLLLGPVSESLVSDVPTGPWVSGQAVGTTDTTVKGDSENPQGHPDVTQAGSSGDASPQRCTWWPAGRTTWALCPLLPGVHRSPTWLSKPPVAVSALARPPRVTIPELQDPGGPWAGTRMWACGPHWEGLGFPLGCRRWGLVSEHSCVTVLTAGPAHHPRVTAASTWLHL